MIGGKLLIEQSKLFAIRAHESINHRRMYTNESYATHLSAVAKLVEDVGGTSEMVAAAWLHDVIEDTPTAPEEIVVNFGEAVAVLVRALTDVSRKEDGNRAERKAIDRVHLATAPPEAQTVKLADLIDNARSITRNDPRFAKVFMIEMRLLLPHLQKGNPTLLREARKIVGQYFG